MANQYNSYYLYQKYEKRGNQSWLPCYPNIFSVDGDGTMPLVLKQENDQACGYIPSGETMYRWINLDPSVDYYCLECGDDGLKVSGTYGSGDTFSVNCDSSTTLVSGDTIQISGITYARVGYCVDTIGDRAFMARGSLSGVSIPTNITSIGASAFTSSLSLIECVIPETVTSIGACAFKDCVSLRNIILWDTITSIGASAFTNCDYLIGVNIPTGLTTIPESCFKGCGALSEVTIPDNITSIGREAFSGCTSLFGVITIGNGVTDIGSSAFTHCSGLTEITIPSGVTNIGDSAFRNCSGLTSITCLAVTPPTISGNVFTNTNDCPIYVPCDSLMDYLGASGWSSYSTRIHGIPPCDSPVRFAATYSSGLTYMTYCASSTSTTLTSGDTKPTGYSYTNMKSADVGNCITEISNKAFSGHTSLSSCTIGSGVTSIGASAFTDCNRLISMVIPDSATSIGEYAFRGCTGLTSINIPNGVTDINAYTFSACHSLSSVTIPNGVTNIKNNAFAACRSFTDVTIPNSVTSIGKSAFQGCVSLTSVTIGDSVTSIGTYAFSSCTNLTSVTILAETPPTFGSNVFDYKPERIFYVPCGSVNAYKAAISTNIGQVYGIPPCD